MYIHKIRKANRIYIKKIPHTYLSEGSRREARVPPEDDLQLSGQVLGPALHLLLLASLLLPTTPISVNLKRRASLQVAC